MRLIDANKLNEHKFLTPQVKVIGGRRNGKIREQLVSAYQKGWNDAIDAIIDNAPTVELFCSYLSDGEVRQPCVEAPCKHERPQDEWIIIKDEMYGDYVKCPFCGKELAGTDLNFCCKCGAKLGKGGAE